MAELKKEGREMIGVSICKALGLNPSELRSLRITIDAPGDVALVTIEREVFDDKKNSLVSVFESMRLVQVDEISGG